MPAWREELQLEAHILPLDIFDPGCLAADLQQFAGSIDPEGLGVGQRIRKTPHPQAAPLAIITNDQLARGSGEAAHHFSAVEDVGVADDNRP